MYPCVTYLCLLELTLSSCNSTSCFLLIAQLKATKSPRMSTTAQNWNCGPIVSKQQAACPRQILVDGLEKSIGSMLMAISEFKVPFPPATGAGPADFKRRRRGKGRTLHDTFQSLTDVYREQNLVFTRNARLDEAVKSFTSEIFDVLGMENFRAPFGRYAHAAGLVHKQATHQERPAPMSGLPSPPRDIAMQNERELMPHWMTTHTNLPIHRIDVPSRNMAEHTSMGLIPEAPSSHRVPAHDSADWYKRQPPAPISGVSQRFISLHGIMLNLYRPSVPRLLSRKADHPRNDKESTGQMFQHNPSNHL